MTETGRFGCTASRPGTPHTTVRLGSGKHKHWPHFVLILFQIILERYFSSFLQTEMCPGDMEWPLMPPPMYNDPPALHFEQATPSHRCNKNPENKGRKVTCCWTPDNRNCSKEQSFTFQRQSMN